MRAIFFILILLVVAAIIAIATGFLDITQTRGARVPEVRADSGNGVAATGGQAPAFDIETGSVSVGTTSRNLTVPSVTVNPPDQQSNQVVNQATNNAN